MHNFVIQQIKKESIARIVVAFAVLIIATLVMYMNVRYIRSYFFDPIPLSADELARVVSPEQTASAWIEFKIEDVRDSGLKMEATATNKITFNSTRWFASNFYIADLGNGKSIVIDSPVAVRTKVVNGYLTEMDPLLKRRLEHEYRSMFTNDFVPLVVETKRNIQLMDVAVIAAGIQSILAIILGVQGLVRWCLPKGHAAYKRIEQRQNADLIAAYVEKELGSNANTKIGRYVLTPNYVVNRSLLKFDLHMLDQLLAAYIAVKRTGRIYLFQTEIHSLLMQWKDTAFNIHSTRAQRQAALNHIAHYAPWALPNHGATSENNRRSSEAIMVPQAHEIKL